MSYASVARNNYHPNRSNYNLVDDFYKDERNRKKPYAMQQSNYLNPYAAAASAYKNLYSPPGIRRGL